jgi:Arc/MetJ family transcription regulator
MNPMRISFEVDDTLMRKAMRASRSRKKREVIEAALRLLIQTHEQSSVRVLRGKVDWKRDLEGSRNGRLPE